MSACLKASAASQASVAVFFDNSNIWIEGCKTYQEKVNRIFNGKPDFRWRLNFIKLLEIVGQGRHHVVPPHMYCSFTTPTEDAMTELWRRFRDYGGVVKSFTRSTWTNKEKMVDIAIVTNAHVALRNNGDIDTLVLITGDGDFKPFIEDVLENYSVNVEIWSWNNALSSALRELAVNHNTRVSTHTLDRFIADIGFLEQEWDLSNEIPAERAIIVQNLTDEMEELIPLCGPYRVFKPVNSNVTVFIYDFAGHRDLTALIHTLKRLARSEDDVFWYGHQAAQRPSLIQSSNVYNVLLSPSPFSPTPGGVWTVVRKDERNASIVYSSSKDLCWFGLYCNNFKKCGRAHLEEDRKYMRRFGAKKKRKTAPCTKIGCIQERCLFVHDGEKTVCMTCDKSFSTPHEWGKCPLIEDFKNGRVI